MMAENMVPLYKLAQRSSAQKMWPQTEHPLIGVEECQARAIFTDSHFENLLHPPFLVSQPLPLLQDVSVPVPGPVLVVSLLA